MLDIRGCTIEPSGPQTLDFKVEPSEIVTSLNLNEAQHLVSAIFEHHGIAAFQHVAAEVIDEFHVADE